MAHRAVFGPQLAESRLSDLTARVASAEDKVTQLKGERSRLYQQLASASDANRTQVCVCVCVHVVAAHQPVADNSQEGTWRASGAFLSSVGCVLPAHR